MSKKRGLAIVLLSGGMDSTLSAAYAAQSNDLAFLHINYGQLTEVRELKAFNEISEYYSTSRKLIVDISYLNQIGGSSLTDSSIDLQNHSLSGLNEIPNSYVPFRNANILSIAVSWAEVINANKIFIGAVEEDSSGYPDCRKSFFNSFNNLIKEGTRPDTDICIETPVIHMTKSEIVLKSLELGSPIHLTWSCYRNNKIACGKCDSCALRLRGFQLAGIEDPICYEKIISYI
jgi:7-cyano-7-deazaguanine synthase